jgi:hypothetical protein
MEGEDDRWDRQLILVVHPPDATTEAERRWMTVAWHVRSSRAKRYRYFTWQRVSRPEALGYKDRIKTRLPRPS